MKNKEHEYQLLDYINADNGCYEDGVYKCGVIRSEGDSKLTILKVKRTSDQVVFEIGDHTTDGVIAEIRFFKLFGEYIVVVDMEDKDIYTLSSLDNTTTSFYKDGRFTYGTPFTKEEKLPEYFNPWADKEGEKHEKDLETYFKQMGGRILRPVDWKIDINDKPKPMKEYKFYHTFKLKDQREVTLCLVTDQSNTNVRIGYSVRVPADENIEGLSRKISYGRANNKPINGGFISGMYREHNGVLKGIAYYWESEFKKDINKYVKGVK